VVRSPGRCGQNATTHSGSAAGSVPTPHAYSGGRVGLEQTSGKLYRAARAYVESRPNNQGVDSVNVRPTGDERTNPRPVGEHDDRPGPFPRSVR